jgi:hypothetical protein
MLDHAIIGADFFNGLQLRLSADGCELLGILVRASATEIVAGKPASHLALTQAVTRLREAALMSADQKWLVGQYLLAAEIIEGIGKELGSKFAATVTAPSSQPTN